MPDGSSLPPAGLYVGRKRIRRLMRRMGIAAVYQLPRTPQPHPGHRIYPYQLCGMTIDRPDQAWCADVTYIPMQRGFLYLVAIMDWVSRKVLSWRLSNSMEASFCVEALEIPEVWVHLPQRPADRLRGPRGRRSAPRLLQRGEASLEPG
ncbi:MAG TPA: hypothetical protein ENO16_00730 [Chromatiales bacterium]|nr:hypothetical protein [Chromatiales bacterium]